MGEYDDRDAAVSAAMSRALDPAQQRQAALAGVSERAAQAVESARRIGETLSPPAPTTKAGPTPIGSSQSDAVAAYARELKMPAGSEPPARTTFAGLSPGVDAFARSLKFPGDAA